MELENLEKVVNIDSVDITVCEGSHVDHRLAKPGLLPMRVSTDIIGSEEGEDLSVLDNLQRSGHHEYQVCDALSLPDDEVSGGTVGHLEVGGQRPEASITSQPECGMSVENSSKTGLFIRILLVLV